MRQARARKRVSNRVVSPNFRAPSTSSKSMDQAATVVASAAANQPITGASPTAITAFTTMATIA